MGIAASQARLLTLTSRLNDLEGKAMRFANQKILMSMQQSDMATEYNKKIEAIERQKELIKKSIQETETLFNSRMDYWFN